MAKRLFFCTACQQYTMKDFCPACEQKTGVRKPAKYSPEDKYAQYRREAKTEQRKKQELI